MKYAVDAGEMRQIEDYTILQAGIPAVELMERAALAVADFVAKKVNKEDRICVVCGKGNNGGDGAAIARLLFIRGYKVSIYVPGYEVENIKTLVQSSINTRTSLLDFQLQKADAAGVIIENQNRLSEYNIIIDAIFGIGLSRFVSGIYEGIINEINNNENTVFSVDIPSGVSADNGKIYNVAVKADYTITFGYMKKGLLLYPGAQYAGKITIADIGLSKDALLLSKPAAFYYQQEDLRLLPARSDYSNKGTYGRVLVIAGSKGMSGAAFMAAKAAYRTGAGLVKVLTSEENRVIIQTLLPEALFSSYYEDDIDDSCRDKILRDLSWASVVIIGPGLGKGRVANKLLDIVLSEAKVPVIIDADAVNLLGERLNDLSDKPNDRLEKLASYLKAGTIITPHLMELSRLTNISLSDIRDNLIDTAAACSYNNEIIYVIKDARTIIAHNGIYYINTSGNNGMATGGSGDVLTGIIGALIAQGMTGYEASCLGVYLHGLAGDEAAKEKSSYSMMATDIIEAIGTVINRSLSSENKLKNE